ncbi:type I polyketide synthase [Actinoplanes sp. TFC3]|uniref:type I polyketide synthase n=1 Tax=Actinoplanes sp. TFC3 TaxID=1710355 RepID=UPI000836BF7C|nr:type I polyketide synthase [Actinoplanes sp. TFC3]
MTDESQLVEYLRKATTELQRTRSRLHELQSRDTEPIAIVGLGCRYPGGVRTPEDLWALVAEGRDAITEFPRDRGWDIANLYDPDPDAAGKSYTREGGFLSDIDLFDADFFGLSPREAAAMDPQQRLLIETSWEALERGGIDPAQLRGSRTGVFTGVMHHDYGGRFTTAPDGFEGYVHTGSAGSMAVGRVSYLFGFEGPAVTVDTACSSSLVSLHLAVQALRNGECDLALAGGVAVMSTPTFFTEYSRQRVLSTDGRCRSFSADGDGTGWSEGVGVLVVERLSDAVRHGHDIWGVVRGSAVNQDGASNGMTAPSGPAQRRVIEAALVGSGLTASDVDILEAHGTGTRLGDPIEAEALLATYGKNRPSGRPLFLGSLKSNIGHTQAAAGVAGVIKMLLAMRHEVMPRSLYADRPTTEVDWSTGTVALLTDDRPWPAGETPRRAGVSSFGMSGTNAHVILEEYTPAPAAPAGGDIAPLVLSGKTPQAVQKQAETLRAYLIEHPDVPLAAVARTLALHRARFPHRAAVAGDRDQVLEALRAIVAVTAGPGRIAAIFSGQGSQHLGMGRDLADAFPVFRAAFDEACAALEPGLREVMWGSDAEALNRTEHAQPALFAFQVALARLWQSWGVTFTAVAGHSVGEIAAAVVAGVLSLDDAARLVSARGRLMQALPEGGAMLAVAAAAGDVTPTLHGGAVIAAVNAPAAVTIAGPVAAIEQLEATWRERGTRTRRLRVSHAFHSPLMDPILPDFAAVAGGLTFREPAIPFSASAGTAHPVTDARYWVGHVRHAVRFHDAITNLAPADILVEIGPDAALTPLLDSAHAAIAGSHRERPEVPVVLGALGEAYAHGAGVDWAAVLPEGGRADVPTYAFQRRRYWLPNAVAHRGAGARVLNHPLLSSAMDLPEQGGLVLTGRISPSTDAWLADHAVGDTVLFPGTGFLELAGQAGAELSDLIVQAPLVLPPSGVDVQLWLAADGTDLVIRSCNADGEWTVHARGRLATGGKESGWTPEQWPPAGAEEIMIDELRADLADRGYAYGPSFQGLRAAWRSGTEMYAEVALPDTNRDPRFGLHPALLDAALHPLAYSGGAQVRLPFAFNGVTRHRSGTSALRVRLQITGDQVRLDAAAPTGEPVLTVAELVLRAADTSRLATVDSRTDRLRYEVQWEPMTAEVTGPAPGTWLILAPGTTDISWAQQQVTDSVRVSLADLPAPGGFAGVLTYLRTPEELLLTVQQLAAAGYQVPVWGLTTDAEHDPQQAAVWGAGRAAALELPELWGGLIDVQGEQAVPLDASEDQIRVRPQATQVPRLRPTPPAAQPWHPTGTVLITGGTGALGAHVARWVAAQGGCDLILVSRSGPQAPGATALHDELTAAGTPVRIVAADVADRTAVAALLAGLGPVHTVIHAAGTGHQQPLLDTTPQTLRSVIDGKVEGARVLDELLPELDAFVLFSSISGVWGAGRQAAYGAGNSALTAVAAARRARGQHATVLAFGPWAEGGMVDADVERQLRRQGLTPMSPATAIAAMAASVSAGTDCVLADVVWSRFLPLFTASRPAPQLQPLERRIAPAVTSTATTSAAAPAGSMLDRVRGEVAATIGQTDATGIDADRPLRELGFDSLMSVQLRNRLAAATGVRLPATLVFDYPTSAALASYLEKQTGTSRAAQPHRPVAVATPVSEPIAIVGMACRYPGEVNGPGDLWNLVAEGRDAIAGFPADRGWDLAHLYDPDRSRAGRSYTRHGGFLNDPAGFDADFFGIPPREALAMDPQQRLLLESAWHALEDAGIDPQSLRGSRTGVFAGIMYNDYYSRLNGIPDGLEGILGLANSNSVMSGRIAYLLGLEGPAITVDTACSSSLVALHLAVQALRQGECDLALAGGATVMATPNIFVEFSRQGGLSPDGRCKSFSADADGTGWSEGVGVIAVERLSDARRLGHEVLAVVRGSAVNSDGASNGLTAPNGPSQQRVMGAALAQAGLTPGDVDAVEAHGTGTRLGDPIEAQAIIATFGEDRDRPLYLGSLKSNLGHSQAAAGVGGIIKMVQALRHETLPRTLHADTATTEVDWSGGGVELLTEQQPWPRREQPRRAGVSSFGISGTNAHVVLEEGDPRRVPADDPGDSEPVPFVLTARTGRGLPLQAAALRDAVRAEPGLPLRDLAWSLATARTGFDHRAVVVAADRAALLDSLDAFATPGAIVPASVASGQRRRGRTVLIFPGQGSQWLGMAQALIAENATFAAAIRDCEQALAPWVEWSLTEVLADPDPAATAPVGVVQPALFAMMVSLARVWQSWGVEVAAVAGHSQGEIAAACVSGALSLADGARIVATRSRLLGELAGTGGMVVVGLPVEQVQPRLGERLSIAAVNGPATVVVSGPGDALDELLAAAERDGVWTRRVDVDYASHSAAVEPLRERLIAGLDGITPTAGSAPLYSTVTGERLTGAELDAEYWYRNLREPVRLTTAIAALAGDGFTFFTESSPHPVLVNAVRETLETLDTDAVVTGSLRRDEGGRAGLLRSAAEGYAGGLGVHWQRVLGSGGRVSVPGYTFAHERFWIDVTDAAPRGRHQATLDSWRYDITWHPREVAATAVPAGRWLLLSTDATGPLAERLRAHGLAADVLTLGDTDRARLAKQLAERTGEYTGILSLLGPDERRDPATPALTRGLALSITAIQALSDTGFAAPLWTLTTSAVGVDGEAPAHPVQSELWGLGRVAALEYPRGWGGLIDLPADPDDAALTGLLAVLADPGPGEDQWAIRAGGARVRRLTRRAPQPAADWEPTGTVLITGATGSLGPHLARSVAERGATHVALLSRRGEQSPGMAELVGELAAKGCTASVFACDVRDRDRLAGVLGELAAAGHPVTTALHAAAHLAIEALETTTSERFAEIVDAKAAGAINLAELLDREHLRDLVLFSSIAGVWGSGDHGGYAAGNAFLDAYAEHAAATGLPVVSVAWGIWDEQVTKDRTDAGAVVRRGLPFLDRDTAFEGLYQAMAGGTAFQIIADVDWPRFVPVFTSARPSPLLTEFAAEPGEPAGSSGTGLRDRLATLSPADREREILELVRAHGGAVLGRSSGELIAADADFRQTGFDSLLSVDLRNRLATATGLKLAPTLLFDHTTPVRLAKYLLGEFAFDDGASVDTVLSRLDHLETDLRTLATDDTQRLRLAARLEALLRSVRPDTTAPALDAAGSTEELLAMLDNQFGES